MSAKSKPEALTGQEAAALLNAHVETVRRLARRGELPSFKIGKDWRFNREALLRWSESTSAQATSQTDGMAPPRARGAATPGAKPAARKAVAGEPFGMVGV